MATFLLIAWLVLIAFLLWINACGRPVRDGLDSQVCETE